VNAKGIDECAPLHWASLHGHTDTIRLLLEHGAEVNARNEWGETPLHWACRRGHTDVAGLLLKAGTNVNARGVGGLTPLHEACACGYNEVTRLLLDHGAVVNARNEWGETPLDLSLQHPRDNPARENILDLFRQYAPDLVMEAWCTLGSSGPGGMR
jgi:ankyrin repeat protein